MALAEMGKYRLVVHASVAEAVFRALQGFGECEFLSPSAEEGKMVCPGSPLHEVDESLGEARFVARFLDPLVENKPSAIDRVLGKTPAFSLADLEKQATSKDLTAVSGELRDLDRRLSELRTEGARLRALLSQMEPLCALPFPLELFNAGTGLLEAHLGRLAEENLFAFTQALRGHLQDRFDLFTPPPQDKDPVRTVAVLVFRSEAATFLKIAEEHDFARIDLPRELSGSPQQEVTVLSARLEEIRSEEAALLERAKEGADHRFQDALLLSDHWSILRSRLESLGETEATAATRLADFWMPVSREEDLRRTLRPFEEGVDLRRTEFEEGDVPPTLLENPRWAAPYEPLTNMYGTPSYGGVDPTALMAPFFFLFFGMCFGDAGYGLVLSALFLYFLVRHQLTGNARKFFLVLAGGSISTVFVGALTGSWLGNTVDAFPFLRFLKPAKDALQILDPMNDPMTFLAISLALGFLQLIFGLLVGMADSLRRKDYMGAFADKGGWILFLVGLVFFGGTSSGILPSSLSGFSKVVAAAGALVLVATQGRGKPTLFGRLLSGVLSLYNVTAYLGDTLSYSRLLALGLSSAAIGMIVNLLCTLVVGVPYVGIPLAVLIFVGGHIFSIAVNILGAFIHSLRLQYVEFFSKFYEANGRPFAPFRCETQFVRLAEKADPLP